MLPGSGFQLIFLRLAGGVEVQVGGLRLRPFGGFLGVRAFKLWGDGAEGGWGEVATEHTNPKTLIGLGFRKASTLLSHRRVPYAFAGHH